MEQHFTTGYGLHSAWSRPQPRKTLIPTHWVPAGETVKLDDWVLPGGMFYIGFGPCPIGAKKSKEPSCICSTSPVADSYFWALVKVCDYRETHPRLPLSYQNFSATVRSAYLSWIRTGRKHPSADPYFALLFLFGLERRAFVDAAADPTIQAEWPGLLAEVQRLRGIYGSLDAFSERASTFEARIQAAMAGKPYKRWPAATTRKS